MAVFDATNPPISLQTQIQPEESVQKKKEIRRNTNTRRSPFLGKKSAHPILEELSVTDSEGEKSKEDKSSLEPVSIYWHPEPTMTQRSEGLGDMKVNLFPGLQQAPLSKRPPKTALKSMSNVFVEDSP